MHFPAIKSRKIWKTHILARKTGFGGAPFLAPGGPKKSEHFPD